MAAPACPVNEMKPGQILPGEGERAYFRRRVEEIVDTRRYPTGSPLRTAPGPRIRYAPAPECDLPAALSIPIAPTTDDSLSPAERRYMSSLDGWALGEAEGNLWGALDEGRDAAITAAELVRRGVLPNARTVSSAVECLRANGFPICSTPTSPAGYWRAATGEEFGDTVRALIRRALRQLKVARQMERAYAELFGGQVVLELEEAQAT